MAELRVRELRCFFCNDLAHNLSYAVFLGPVYSAVAESYDVDSCKIVVHCSTGENPIAASTSSPDKASEKVLAAMGFSPVEQWTTILHESTSSPDKASEIVSGVLVALEDCICSVACDGGDQEVEFDGLVGKIIGNIVKRR